MLRGLAILLVLLRHSWPELFGGGGIVGVVMFFTLSGYLITGLLVSDVRRFGRIRFGRFYRNRAIRLVPAMLFLLIAFVVVEGIWNVSGTQHQVFRSVVVALTYTMDVPGFAHGSPSLVHLWTLANEEQFYLVWPLIILLGLRLRKLRLVIVIAGSVLLLALIASILLTYPNMGKIYTLPSTWTISMVLGAAAQLGKRQLATLLRGRRATYAAVVAFAGLLLLAFFPEAKDNPFVYLLGGSSIAALTIVLIAKVQHWEVVGDWLKPLVGLGTISYSAYLWNYPIGIWLRDWGFDEAWRLLAPALTVLVATISWFAVEAPINRLKSYLDLRSGGGGSGLETESEREPRDLVRT